MKGSRWAKGLMNELRNLYGKKNGVVPSWALDIPRLDCDSMEKPKYARRCNNVDNDD